LGRSFPGSGGVLSIATRDERERRTTTMESLEVELTRLLNKCSAENGSDTPDFILAQYLTACLDAFNHAVQQRENWYGRVQPETVK
jgi:hypothetical protein